MPQFDRIASLRIGKSGQEQLLEITGLRITFRITKNLEATTNTGVITIYNLSQDTRNKLQEVYDTLILEAGYQKGEGLKLMFKGNISESFTTRRGPDLVTTIRSGDGLKAIVETKFNQGYAAGTSAWDILNDILKTFNLSKKITNRLKAIARKKGKKFANAFSSSGSAKNAMDRIIKQLDGEWSVQNGSIKILELEGVDDSPVTFLDFSTGLIGLPIRLSNLKKRQSTKKKVEAGGEIKDVQRRGWRIESLLLPELEPGARLKAQEPVSGIDGVFRVEAIEQRGDNYGNNWSSFITVSDLN
ncbi:hypothetical protein KAR91_48730 [Candidatus Pacearchaeota archaeon]|nr:hypothetical protein [Candidatus Pacearchaeota archaeon]